MCFNPFKFVGDIFKRIFGGSPQGPQGPGTYAKGLSQKLSRPRVEEKEDKDIKKDKGETETDLSEAQGEALKRVADSTKQTGKATATQADLMAALSGVGDAPTGGITAPVKTLKQIAAKGGGGAGY